MMVIADILFFLGAQEPQQTIGASAVQDPGVVTLSQYRAVKMPAAPARRYTQMNNLTGLTLTLTQ